MASEPYVKCESCTLFVPPSDLHPCGPGGRWRYCSRCFAHTETWPETKDTSRTSNQQSRPFQLRVVDWMMETFSQEVCRDTTERNHRFLEESLELVQAMGGTAAEAHMLVDYVFGRPVGEPEQEVGGVMVTLAALCAAADFSMAACGDTELARCWKNIERIRAKQAGKPKHSPLPGPSDETPREPEGGGHGELCAFCGESCDIFAGDPGRWPLAFGRPDGTGEIRYHHSDCVTARLFTQSPPKTNEPHSEGGQS